jgi:hypothetical protein
MSETLGTITREARLFFILLWTFADDSGRARASSRILASFLYPFDNDAIDHIDDWMGELEGIDAIRLYRVESTTYLEITNWCKHQKIDKPSASRLPQFDEASRVLARPSRLDLGPRTLDLVSSTKDQGPKDSASHCAAIAAPVRSTAVSLKAKGMADPLYRTIWDSFIGQSKAFANYPKEAEATKRLVRMASDFAKGDEDQFSKLMVTKFHHLIQGGDKFWRGQPFTPSALSSLYERVIQELRSAGDPNWTDHIEDYASMAEGIEF